MLVGIYMIELQTGRAERLELCPNLTGELKANLRQKKEADAGARHVLIEPAVASHKPRDFGAAEGRVPID
jgi:hypothetical protein